MPSRDTPRNPYSDRGAERERTAEVATTQRDAALNRRDLPRLPERKQRAAAADLPRRGESAVGRPMVSSAALPDAKRATPLRSSSATLKPQTTIVHPTDSASVPAPRRAAMQRSDALSLPEAKRRGEVVSLPPREERAARSEVATDGIVATPQRAAATQGFDTRSEVAAPLV